MVAGSVQFYDVVVFFHVTAVVLAFGPTFGYAIFQTMAERTSPRSIPTVMRAMTTIDRYLLTPAVLVLLAAGIYLTSERWEFGDVFVGVGIAVVLVLLGLTHAFFIPYEQKLAALAERDIAAAGDGEVELSAEYRQASKRIERVGTLTGLAVILTIYFMAAKPFL